MIDRLGERAQSEVIGAMLLTAVIIIVMLTAAAFVFEDVTGDEDQVLADIDYEVTADEITLKHNSGDTFDSADITVRTIGDVEETLTLEKNFTNGDSFSPGSSWTTEDNAFNGDDGQAGTLLVIHEPTNTVLLSESFVIGEPEDDEDEDEDVDGFNIEILDFDSPVEPGEEVEVQVNVTNTGDERDDQDIRLEIDGDEVDSDEIKNLDPAESEEITFTWDDTTDAGTYTANVSSEDDSEEADVTVLAEAEFEVTITETNEPAAGEDIEVTVDIENVGDLEGTQSVELTTEPDIGENSIEITLDGGESTAETLSVATQFGDDDEYTVTVASEDDEDSDEVTVAEVDPVLESVEAEANTGQGEQAESVDFYYELSEDQNIELRILDENEEIVGSDVVENAEDGNEFVDITDGGQGGGERQSYPLVVEVEVLETGELCSVEIENGGNRIELCD